MAYINKKKIYFAGISKGISERYTEGVIIEDIEPEVSLISFTIAGTSYQAEEDMTWTEFVNSSYNPSSTYYPYKMFYLADAANVNTVIYYNDDGSGRTVLNANGATVRGSKVINQSNYQLPQTGGAN